MSKPRRRKGEEHSKLISDEAFRDATGTNERRLSIELIQQAMGTVWFFKNASEEDRENRLMVLLDALKGIRPSDEIEGMLAIQMVGTHNAAMECLRRAMHPDAPFEIRDQDLKLSSKLLTLYTRQMDALNKNRGKGQQKVTVEHVHVEAGAQAVVGHIDTTKGHMSGASRTKGTGTKLRHSPTETVDLLARQRKPIKQSRRRAE